MYVLRMKIVNGLQLCQLTDTKHTLLGGLMFLGDVAFCLLGATSNISQQSAVKPWQLRIEPASSCLQS